MSDEIAKSAVGIDIARVGERLARIDEQLKGINDKLALLGTADSKASDKADAASANRATYAQDFIAFSTRVDAKLVEHDRILDRQNKLVWIIVLENAGVLIAIISLVIKLIEFMGGP